MPRGASRFSTVGPVHDVEHVSWLALISFWFSSITSTIDGYVEPRLGDGLCLYPFRRVHGALGLLARPWMPIHFACPVAKGLYGVLAVWCGNWRLNAPRDSRPVAAKGNVSCRYAVTVTGALAKQHASSNETEFSACQAVVS